MRRHWALPARLALSGALAMSSVTAAACRPSAEAPPPRVQLFEKERYQALYASDGRLLRVVFDRDGDRRVDVVTLFDLEGRPSALEIDSDADGVVDRWERYGADGTLEKVGASRSRPGHPDVWVRRTPGGEVVRRDLDENGDGFVDRSEFLEDGRVVREELDTDGDGRADRRLLRGAGGTLAGIEADLDGDGRWEKAIAVKRPARD